MNKRRVYLNILVVSAALLILAGRALCYQAEVEDISGKKYFPAVKEAIQEAKESIFMVMFVVGIRPHDKTSGVYQLMQELIRAHKRKVKVTLILDQNIDFVGKDNIDEWWIEGKNAWCFKMAKEAGIDVYYDDPVKYTHAKTLLIDGEYVILGSANWTESALHRNFETNVLIKSKGLAEELLSRFKAIQTHSEAAVKTDPLNPPVPISWQFLEGPELAGKMVTSQAERSFDLYLLLLRQFDGNQKAEVVLDYDRTAKSLGLYERMNRTAYRRQITKCLRRLESRYNLIKFKPQHAEDAIITLLSYDDPNTVYSHPEEGSFPLPETYFRYGWNRRLSLKAKLCYLINLAFVSISSAKPWWSASVDTLSKTCNVNEWTVITGMQELRRHNIIDVSYAPFNREDPDSRPTKRYKLLNLYDPAWLEAKLDKLELLYGQDKLNQAMDFAKIVYEENDPEIIENIIASINTFGEEKVEDAFAIVAKKRPDNPKRNYRYVVGILQGKATREK